MLDFGFEVAALAGVEVLHGEDVRLDEAHVLDMLCLVLVGVDLTPSCSLTLLELASPDEALAVEDALTLEVEVCFAGKEKCLDHCQCPILLEFGLGMGVKCFEVDAMRVLVFTVDAL